MDGRELLNCVLEGVKVEEVVTEEGEQEERESGQEEGTADALYRLRLSARYTRATFASIPFAFNFNM